MPFKKLFRSSGKSADGLTQPAREAIVDVLHYCMYADKHVAIREDEFIEATARTLDWDANISYEYYEGKSTGSVSQALASKETRKAFFEDLRSRLPRREDRELALKLAEDLAESDGRKVHAEEKAIAMIREVLATG